MMGRFSVNLEGQIVGNLEEMMENSCGKHIFPKETGAHSDMHE